MIRRYREADRAILMEITITCFPKVSIDRNIEDRFGTVGGKDWTWRKKRQIEADIEACPEGILVAEIDGSVVGYVISRLEPESKIGHINNMAVLPAC
jgi:ribosomal protein S18 acetylase RimI-like enzyme